MKRIVLLGAVFLASIMPLSISAIEKWNINDVFVEAERFSSKGGWKIDQQFMDIMGSPYLLAHGMGVKVKDAQSIVNFKKKGTYYAYVRTYNWTSLWSNKKGAGEFCLKVGNKYLSNNLGSSGYRWEWQYAGKVSIKNLKTRVVLHDLTGFDGRCDAIYFTTRKGYYPPNGVKELEAFRLMMMPELAKVKEYNDFDFVVVGGGLSGMCAAMSAARNGCKVALIQDRPVPGGNNSSEVRVSAGGDISLGLYPNIGNMIEEFGQGKKKNAQAAEVYCDRKKMDWLASNDNITCFYSTHANGVVMDGKRIARVLAQNIETDEKLSFKTPFIADCTGDGSIGALAGADYRVGRESKDEFYEDMAPDTADTQVMGTSIMWNSSEVNKVSHFPKFNYGLSFNDSTCERIKIGDWQWETGMNLDQVKDAERIRDYGLLAVYSNWSYLKNDLKDNKDFRNLNLNWVAYIGGKRESRRLLGDYILKQNDILRDIRHEDACVSTTWSIDLHYPDPENSKNFPGGEFKSISKHTIFHPYPIPYRCLYSRNINNLFMAGRDISVTHVALGSVRVINTGGMMGEVVGMAASVCKKYNITPREVYQNHFDDMKLLMNKGAGIKPIKHTVYPGASGSSIPRPEVNKEVIQLKGKHKKLTRVTTTIRYNMKE